MLKVTMRLEKSGIAFLFIDNPSKRNVLDSEVMSGLESHVQKLYSFKNELKALVISSADPSFFSAGGNIKEWKSFEKEEAYQEGLRGSNIFRAIENLPVMTIAAISGDCLGGGNELAMSCDYRIATEASNFAQPEVLLGNGLSWGGYYRLVKMIGFPKAKEMILLGHTYSSAEALEMGLINQVVSDWGELHEKVQEIAENVAVNVNTVRVSKDILNQIGNQLVPNSALIDSLSASHFAQTSDSVRRKEAFVNKRLNEEIELELSKLRSQ